jgi:benzodiazapine receptor
MMLTASSNKKNQVFSIFMSFHCEILLLSLVTLLFCIPFGTPLRAAATRRPWIVPLVQYDRTTEQQQVLFPPRKRDAGISSISTKSLTGIRSSSSTARSSSICMSRSNDTARKLSSGIYSLSSFTSLVAFVWSAVTARIPSGILVPAIYILATILGGNLGTPFVIAAKKAWYDRIPKPKWTPPNYVFAPVWITLYTLIGLASYRMTYLLPRSTCTSFTQLHRLTVSLYGIHYLLNVIWAPIFFGGKCLRLGHVLNVLLISTLLPVLYCFYQMDRLSSILLFPYLLWLIVAAALSNGICKLNPTTKGYNNAMLQADIYDYQQKAAKYIGL